MTKDLDITIKSINKKFGDNTIGRIKEMSKIKVKRVSSGSPYLDYCIGGGWPLGKTVELFGPYSSGKSLIALRTIVEAQKEDLNCVYLDAENAFDPEFAKLIGIDIDKLTISQISSGEKVFDIIDLLLDSEVSIIVVDSVASLVPQYEIEESMEKQTMALQARLMSKALRKITGKAARNKTLIFFINQIREKIQAYGCLHGDTLINFVNKQSLPIKTVVEKKIKGKVWTYNEKTDSIEQNEILDWHTNGRVNNKEDFIHIETKSINGGGKFGFTATPSHKILTHKGWKEAKDIVLKDKLVSKYKKTLTKSFGDFMWACFIGDSHLSIRSENTACLKLQDNKNKDYLNWKLSKISKFLKFKKRFRRYESVFTYELAKVKKEINNRDPLVMLNNHYSNLGLSVWIMDDGHYDNKNYHNRYIISLKRFKNNKEKLDLISHKLTNLGYDNSYNLKNGNISFTSAATKKIMSKICKYVPKCMQYKLAKEFQNRYVDFELESKNIKEKELVKIISIRNASKRQLRNKNKYDLSIKNSHNYIVGGINNGVVVHNSPETTSGGRALGFYSALRVSIRTGDLIRDNKKVTGQEVKFKVVKSKVCQPYRDGYFIFYHPDKAKSNLELFDNADELVSMLLIEDKIERRGAYYYVGEDHYQGREELEHKVRTDKKFRKKLKAMLKK